AISESKPPRRTGTVTETGSPSEIWRAFQLPEAVTTYGWRRAAAHTTPLERGSPSGVTKLITAKAVFSSTRQIRSVVRLRADAIVVFSTASQSEHVHHPLVGPHPGAPTSA